MVVEQTPRVIEKFKKQGYPITEESIAVLADLQAAQARRFHSVLEGKNYEEKKQKFYELVRCLPPGLNEIIFHPSVLSDTLKAITGTWQQRPGKPRCSPIPKCTPSSSARG